MGFSSPWSDLSCWRKKQWGEHLNKQRRCNMYSCTLTQKHIQFRQRPKHNENSSRPNSDKNSTFIKKIQHKSAISPPPHLAAWNMPHLRHKIRGLTNISSVHLPPPSRTFLRHAYLQDDGMRVAEQSPALARSHRVTGSRPGRSYDWRASCSALQPRLTANESNSFS